MLVLYLKQLMESKKEVYEAMERGDFGAVSILMEKYKKMEEKLQIPIYLRINKMSNEEIQQLAHALNSKGMDFDLNDNDLKEKIVSKFIDTSIVDKSFYNATSKVRISVNLNASGDSSVRINSLDGCKSFNYSTSLDKRLLNILKLDTLLDYNGVCDYQLLSALESYSKNWDKLKYDFYSADEYNNILVVLGVLQKAKDEFVDIASPEYQTILNLCKKSSNIQQQDTPLLISNLDHVKRQISKIFYEFHGVSSVTDEQAIKESQMVPKIWEEIFLEQTDEEGIRLEQLRKELSQDANFQIDSSIQYIKKLEQEILATTTRYSVSDSKFKSYVSDMRNYHKNKIKEFFKKIENSRLTSTQEYYMTNGHIDFEYYYKNPEKLEEILQMHRQRSDEFDDLSRLLACNSLESLKKKVKESTFCYRLIEALTNYLSRIEPRKDLIQYICRDIFMKLDDVYVRNGFKSILKIELSTHDFLNGGSINWYDFLVEYKEDIPNLIEKINEDLIIINKLKHFISEACKFELDYERKRDDFIESTKEFSKIGSFPTFDGTFKFESDIESLSDYVYEFVKKK